MKSRRQLQNNRAYLLRRAVDERRAAASASCEEARLAHRQLARCYAAEARVARTGARHPDPDPSTYQPARQPSDCDSIEAFTAEVGKWLSDIRPVNPEAATRAVFGVLLRHIDPGQIAKIRNVLPASIREFWETIEVEREPALADG